MARDEDGEQAMSAERLAEIRRVSDRFNGEAGSYAGSSHHPTRDSAMLGHAMPDMLAEVERLRAALAAAEAREAALLAVVRAVAKGPHWAIDLFTLQEQARALLASAEQEGGGDGA